MTAITFDTLAFAKKLKEAGVPAKQAEIHVEITAEMMKEISDTQIATKHDLQILKTSLHRDMSDLKSDLKQDIANLTIKMAYMILGSATLFAAIVKIINLI